MSTQRLAVPFNLNAGHPPQREPLGCRARRLFRRLLRADHSLRGRRKWFYLRLITPILNLGRILPQLISIAPEAKRLSGTSIARQIRDQIRLVLGHGATPWVYYMEELYKPGAMAEAGEYVMRSEMKFGLIKAFTRLAKDNPGRSPLPHHSLGDKLKTAAWCAEAGLPHPEPLMLIAQGEVTWQTKGLADLDQDLFVKPRRGRGAEGVDWYTRIESFIYLDRGGQTVTLGQIIDRLKGRTKAEGLIVMPRLRNHPVIAGLARQSLVTLRVFTCLDERLQPVVTNAFLRSLTKLEPSWDTGPIEEYAAAIDLETGTLGPMTGDKPFCLSTWVDRHPITGVQVTGRVLPFWREVMDLAAAAHRQVPQRVLVGWDIAITEEGPMLIEGNSMPDTIFPQRIYRRPIGRMRLGELLNFHLGRVEAKLGPSGKAH